MKRPSSGRLIGGYIAGGLLALYLLGFVVLWIDYELELLLTMGIPEPIGYLLCVLYGPLFRLFGI